MNCTAAWQLPLIICRSNAAADRRPRAASPLVSCGTDLPTPGRIGHLPKDRLLGLVDRFASSGPGPWNVPVLMHDVRIDGTVWIDGAVRIQRTFVVEASAVGMSRAVAAARRTARPAMRFVADVGRTAAILITQAAHRTAMRRRAVAVAVHRREQSLERSEVATALRTGEAAVAWIARIAAIGRIADPLSDVDVAAALLADTIAIEPGQETALLRAVATRFARPRPAFVAAAVPDDRPRPREAAGVTTRSAAGIAARLRATATRGGHEPGQGQRKEQASRHDGLPKRCQTSAVSICRVSYRPANSRESTKSR